MADSSMEMDASSPLFDPSYSDEEDAGSPDTDASSPRPASKRSRARNVHIPWTKEEDELLFRVGAERERTGGSWSDYLEGFGGRSAKALGCRWRLHLDPKLHEYKSTYNGRRDWTAEEDQLLMSLASKRTKIEAAASTWKALTVHFAADRTEGALSHRWEKLKKVLPSEVIGTDEDYTKKQWTEEEDFLMRKLCMRPLGVNITKREWEDVLAQFPGRTKVGVRRHWTILRAESKAGKADCGPPNIQIRWTQEEELKLAQLVSVQPELSLTDIASHFPHRQKAVIIRRATAMRNGKPVQVTNLPSKPWAELISRPPTVKRPKKVPVPPTQPIDIPSVLLPITTKVAEEVSETERRKKWDAAYDKIMCVGQVFSDMLEEMKNDPLFQSE